MLLYAHEGSMYIFNLQYIKAVYNMGNMKYTHSRIRLFFTLCIIVFLIPFLGFPSFWEQAALIVIGIVISVTAVRMHKDSGGWVKSMKDKAYQVNNNNGEKTQSTVVS